jgi:hypothetical protein
MGNFKRDRLRFGEAFAKRVAEEVLLLKHFTMIIKI